ncbi:Hemerythrin-like domain-containing protein [Clostridium acidisoli DSM 12555]|uniref:Hemerythrin-like domain-containing protein n=1 Tax=Clostridium acidisoli DSM 12555 TaxID=1121291 RepID=A0A1W1X428_9CLOT|nr:hemerythrin domain-containing protein [Clostridium acidisoli]SMC18171.1 Hemerythrin-like domain-containing protein [Clostridium acidisoli DSM 12555]
MDTINLMIEEHKNIKRMLLVVRKASFKVLQTGEINYEDFNKMILFVRNYADAHHHGKEEKMLFNRMVDEIGGVAETLVKFGMLVEHDLGRLFMTDLEQALIKVKNGDNEAKIDVIANAVSYTNLLQRHIDKEDNVVYTFARRKLSKETLRNIDEECESFEKEMQEKKIQERYIKLLEELEKKYL